MAATYTDNGTNTPNGSHLEFTYTFPVILSTDVKVSLNGVTQATTKYTVSTSPAKITFNNTSVDSTVQETTGAPKTGVTVRIYRETAVGKASGDEDPKAVFAAGSSVRAADLNSNFEQVLFAVHEKQNQLILAEDIDTGAVTSAKILDDTIVNADVNTSAAIAGTKVSPNFGSQAVVTTGTLAAGATTVTGNIAVSGTVDGRDVATDGSKLDGIEAGSTGDQTNAEIRAAVEAATDSNVFTDADHTKLNSIETGATGDQTNAEIRAAVEAATDSNVFTDADHSKLNAIEASATADQTAAEIRTLVESASDSNVFTDADHTKVNAAATVTGSETLTNKTLTSPVINDMSGTAVVTSGTSTSDNKTYSAKRAGEIFYGKDTVGEIQSGETWSAADDKVATTSAIDARIIDLVDDVGGFVPIANETSFPNANPDVNNGAGTLVSIKALASNLVSNGSGVATIANGTVGNSTVTINGLANSTTYAATFGMIVETTTTLNTYTFHRQVPKATEVTTVAGSVSNVNTVAGNISNVNTVGGISSNVTTVAGVSSNVTTVAGISSNVTTVAGISSDVTAVAGDATDIGAVAAKATEIGRLGTADAVADMNTLGTNAIVSDLDTCATSISNINTTAGSISNVNTVASNIGTVNDFAARYRTGSSNPTSSLDVGDLFFNTTANELKVYNGSAWQGGVTASGNFASTTGNTFTGDNLYNDTVKAKFGTGSDLQIYHDATDSYITNSTGNLVIRNTSGDAGVIGIQPKSGENAILCRDDNNVELYYDGVKKLQTRSGGVGISNDSDALFIGADDDVKLYHNSGNAILKSQTGTLYLASNSHIDLRTTAGSEKQAIFCNINGSVDLYHNNSKKFETTANGVTITGNQNFADNGYAYFGAGNDMGLYSDGSGGFIKSDDLTIGSFTGGEKYIDATLNGAVDLYYDGTKNLATTGTGIQVEGSDSGDQIRIIPSGTNAYGTIDFESPGTGGGRIKVQGEDAVQIIKDGAVELYYNNVKTFSTNTLGIIVYGDEGGAAQIDFAADQGDDNADKWKAGATDDGHFFISNKNSGAWEQNIECNREGNVELYYDNSKKAETHANGLNVTGRLYVTSHINLDDNTSGEVGKLSLGGGNDFQLYHDGSNSYIVNATNNLHIWGGGDGNGIYIRPKQGESSIAALANGAVELYYDNVKTFETLSTGIKVQGAEGGHAEIYIYADEGDDDADKYLLQSGTDGAFYIKNYTSGSQEVNLKTTGNGAVELYYDAVKKFETKSNGVTITGEVKVTTDLVMNSADSQKIYLGDGNDLQLWHDGSNSYVKNANSGADLLIESANNTYIKHGGENCAKFTGDGAVELYYDNTLKFGTDSAGVYARGDLMLNYADDYKIKLGASNDLQIYHNGYNSYIQHGTVGNLRYQSGNHLFYNQAGDELLCRMDQNDSVSLYYDSSKKFETTSSGITVTGSINASGLSKASGNMYINNNDTTNGIITFATNTNDRWKIDFSGNLLPAVNNDVNIGSSSYRVANLYVNDMHFANSPENTNSVDGTWGDWTLQEGEENIYMLNNRTGKKYKMALQEVV